MIRAIVWKEFREQGLIGLTLVVFGAGILVAAATLAEPPAQGASPADVVRFLGAGLLATMMLAVTAGTVCGGALFAAEREAGTIGFLESLPVSRWRIWWAKLAAGSLLACGQIALVLACAAALGLVQTAGWAFAITIFALLAFAWGVYGSTHAQTTLGSVGVAVPTGTGAFLLYFLPLWLIFPNPRTNMLQPEGGLIFLALMFVTPLIGSAMRFTRTDRERSEDDPGITIRQAGADESSPESRLQRDPFTERRPRIGITALLWLSWRQLVRPGLVIAVLAAVLGLSLLPDGVHPVMLWPGMALTAGVLAGVTVFMDEQSSGSCRYWGERRMPVGRLWAVKFAVHAAFALLLGFILMLPSAIRAEASGMQMLRGGSFFTFTFRSLLFDNMQLGSQGWKLVLLPLAYGFAAGQLCGMLFRKAVVAAGVAGIVGGSLAAFWIPSLLSGGTHLWQIWAAPVLALATSRLILRAWSAEQLPTRRPLGALIAGLAVILLFQVVGLGWRVLEVPDEPESEADTIYVASLPPLEANDSGRQFRTAAERFARTAQAIPAPPRTPGAPPRGSLEDRLNNLPYHAWTADDPEVADWLDKVCMHEPAPGETDEPWFTQAASAGHDPTGGIFEHPLRAGSTASLQTLANGRRMGLVLLGRGLQKQSRGDHAGFTGDLRTVLALGRAFRNGSVAVSLGFGNELGRAACSATDRWLAAYRGPAQHLQSAIRLLQEDDPVTPFDPMPHLLAERYVLRELAKAPGQILPAQLTPPGRDREQCAPIVDLVGVAWNTPWERERTRRLSGLGYERGDPGDAMKKLLLGRPGSSIFLTRKTTPNEMIENDRQLRLHRRAILLLVAIHLYHLETGAAPASLDELVRAGCLPAVPTDPYGERPFRYRISAGEVLLPPPAAPSLVPVGMKTPPGQEPRAIPAGQPVFWSVGMNRTDDGGISLPVRPGAVRSGTDLVYLPNLPEKP